METLNQLKWRDEQASLTRVLQVLHKYKEDSVVKTLNARRLNNMYWVASEMRRADKGFRSCNMYSNNGLSSHYAIYLDRHDKRSYVMVCFNNAGEVWVAGDRAGWAWAGRQRVEDIIPKLKENIPKWSVF